MKYVALVAMMVLICGVAFAAETGNTLWHHHSYTDNDSYQDRYSEYQEKQGMALGIGTDVVLYQFWGYESKCV